MQYGCLIDAALQSRSERYVAEIFDALRSVSVASRSNKPIGDKMIMNAAFLVSREMEQAFDARVKQIGQQVRQAHVQVHGSVAAVQLRQHSLEARTGALNRLRAHGQGVKAYRSGLMPARRENGLRRAVMSPHEP